MKNLARNMILFVAATVAARLFGVVRTFWLARVLNPADYGVWIFILLISAYAPILNLGTLETLVKKVPFFQGKGDTRSIRETEGGAFSFSLFIGALFLVAAALAPLALGGETLHRFVLPAQLMLLSVSFTSVSSFWFFRMQARQGFDMVSAITTGRAAVVLVLQIALSYRFGLVGAVAGYLLSEVVVFGAAFWLDRRTNQPVLPRVGLRLYGNLIRTGLPITIVWWTFMIQTTVDRIVSMAMLGEAPTGYYGIGMSIAAMFLLLPDAINQVLYPHINETYGRTKDRRKLAALVVDPARIIALALPLFACLSMLTLPLVFTVIVPRYMPGLATAQILIVSALYAALTKGGTNLLISIDRQWSVLGNIAACIAINLCGNVVLVRLGLGIEGIAISTAVASSVFAVTIWLLVFRAIGYRARESVGAATALFGPALLFTIVTIAYRVVMRNRVEGTLASVAILLGLLSVYWVAVLAIPAYRATMTVAIRSVWRALVSRLKGRNPSAEPGRESWTND
jgi:O-antigen/teichoic acid export membrane protein